ncbi:metalloprotease [Gordonia phage Anon]|nr:metalloprotease [Gordonia phage Anon]
MTGGGTGGSSGGGSGGSGGGSGVETPVHKPLEITFSDDTPADVRIKQQEMFDEMPEKLRDALARAGTEINVGPRADGTPGWERFAKVTGYDSETTIADGRELGTLSFFQWDTNQIFISTDHPGGSVNVYVHEMAHAIDAKFLGETYVVEFPPDSGKMVDVNAISDDPGWKEMHTTYVLNNPHVNSYYRGGPSGKSPLMGRRETFAEGFAIYNKYGRSGLVGWLRSEDGADEIIDLWKYWKVI